MVGPLSGGVEMWCHLLINKKLFPIPFGIGNRLRTVKEGGVFGFPGG